MIPFSTIYVPDDFSTIKRAIDSAGNSDLIIIRSGIYIEDVVDTKLLQFSN
jgi:pectin methylesterase-like acyl-CoA thioesterase